MSIFDKYENKFLDNLDRSEEINYSYCDPEEATAPTINSVPEAPNIRVFILFVTIVLIILSIRLFQIQIVQGRENASMAKSNSIRQVISTPRRGNIMDARGEWLTRNNASFNVVLNANYLPKKNGDRESFILNIATTLSLNDEEKQRVLKQIEGVN